MERCPHFDQMRDQMRDVMPSADGCEECLKLRDEWHGLRMCLTCGHIGCCDDSKNRHARKHFEQTQHPLIRSIERGERWGWCYVDKKYFDKMPPLPGRNPWAFLARWLGR